jgi:hypothetical protein
MTKEERDLVIDLATQEISQADFLERFRDSVDGRRLCGELLTESLQSKVPEDVECALILGYIFGFTNDHLKALLELACAQWHFKHEDVVTALGRLKTPKAVDALYANTQWIPAYLDFDESRALAVKAIWALGDIDGPEASAALDRLTTASDPILVDAATHQLERRHIPS